MAGDAFAFKRVALIGVGLIGGSLGLALKRLGLCERIVGVSRPQTIERAKAVGAVDEGVDYAHLRDGVCDANLVFLCTPISRIIELLPETLEAAPMGCVVSDVGSTKRTIVSLADAHGRDGVHFIGGHPMAGSEWKGVDAADPFLFQNAIYVITPGNGVPEAVCDRFASVIDRIGARILRLEPDVHDRIAAAISHLPQMMATALVGMVGRMDREDGLALQMAAGGFWDLTRIASSPFEMWRDICRTNADDIRSRIDQFQEALSGMRSRLEEDVLEEDFDFANKVRGSIPKDSKGFLNPLHEVLVVVEDRPGVISEVATALADASINIKDIEVLKVREGEGGSLRLGFGDADDSSQAARILGDLGFKVRIR